MLADGAIALMAIAASALLTRAMIAYASRRRLVDVPNERSSHAVPTPRGGGLALAVVFLAGLAVVAARASLPAGACLALAGSGAIGAAVGFWDDHGHVSPRHRVLVHFLAAGWALCCLGGFPAVAGTVTIAAVVQNVFWLVALVWFLNAFNFMDGIDGIAGTEAAFIAGASGVLLLLSGDSSLAMVAFLLLAVTAGFLLWNLPPARIFMGDVGSSFLGIVLGVLAIVSVRQGALNMWVWTILFGVFMVDATVTVFIRIVRGARWHEAHCSHAYQHLVRKLKSHGRVTGGVTAINVIWLFPLAFAAWRWPQFGPFIAFGAYLPLVGLAMHFRAGLDD